MAITVSFFIVNVFVASLICQPFRFYWDKSIEGHCGDTSATVKFTAGTNMALDFIIMILPMPTVWKLQMGIKKKMLLSGMFSMSLSYVYTPGESMFGTTKVSNSASSICAVNAFRIASGVDLTDDDYSYDLTNELLAAHLELWLGVIAANLPTLQPVYAATYDRLAKLLRNMSDKGGQRQPHNTRSLNVRQISLKRPGFRRIRDSVYELEEGRGAVMESSAKASHIPRDEENGANDTPAALDVITVRRDLDIYVSS